jgi:type VI secretion system protein ImpM
MSSAVEPQDALTTGLFGKLPTASDFLRIHLSGAALEFADHLEDAVNACHRAECDFGGSPSFFVYHAPDSAAALIGSLRPSRDKVGRIFPLAVFTEIEAESAAGNFDIVPLAFSPFFSAGLALGDEGETLEASTLEARVSALPFPTLEEFEAAQAEGDRLLVETSIDVFRKSLPPPASTNLVAYAVHTLASACAQSRALVGDTKPGITLDVPLLAPGDPILWLGILRRLLGEQPVPPNILWKPATPSPSHGSVKIDLPARPGRLLVSFGAPSPSALAFLAGALGDSPKLWPVISRDEAVLEGVLASLSPPQLEVLSNPDASLDGLAAAFEGELRDG